MSTNWRGGLQGGLSGAMSGAMIGAAGGPITWMGGAALGALGGMFGGGDEGPDYGALLKKQQNLYRNAGSDVIRQLNRNIPRQFSLASPYIDVGNQAFRQLSANYGLTPPEMSVPKAEDFKLYGNNPGDMFSLQPSKWVASNTNEPWKDGWNEGGNKGFKILNPAWLQWAEEAGFGVRGDFSLDPATTGGLNEQAFNAPKI